MHNMCRSIINIEDASKQRSCITETWRLLEQAGCVYDV